MINFSSNRWLIVAIGHYVTLFFIGQANYYLAPLGIQIYALGMLISFSALELSFRQGAFSLVPVALYLDSKTPLPFGYTLLVSLTLFTIAHLASSRLRREISASSLATSLLVNAAAFAGITFGVVRYLGAEGLHFGPIALNLLASSVVVAVLNRLFVETQSGVLSIFGINLAEEQREAR